MRVFLTTLGCRLNEAEVASWSRQLESAGHHVVAAPQDAQVMVVNTCAVTAEAARKSRKLVAGLHRKSPDAPIAITGCYSQLAPDEAAALAGVDLVVSNADKERLVDRLLAEIEPAAMPALATEPESAHPHREARTRAFVKVQDGCRNRCSFCIVTIARGDEQSRPIEDVVAELRALAATGTREAVLTGVHLGGYGSDLGCTLTDLVRAVLERSGLDRIRLSSLEPWDLPADFASLWQDRRLMPHLHLPLQSGSDPVLRRMSRRCSTAAYAALVDSLRAAIPDVMLTTDVIVGFPGETDAEWAETMAFVDQIGFAHIHVFAYSARQGTKAARMPGAVPTQVKRARSQELSRLAAAMKAEHLSRQIGRERPVLWEGAGELDAGGLRRFTGYTDNYLRVQTAVDGAISLENRITPTRLFGVIGDLLTGEIRDAGGPAAATIGAWG